MFLMVVPNIWLTKEGDPRIIDVNTSERRTVWALLKYRLNNRTQAIRVNTESPTPTTQYVKWL
jgi:hypothetical protein